MKRRTRTTAQFKLENEIQSADPGLCRCGQRGGCVYDDQNLSHWMCQDCQRAAQDAAFTALGIQRVQYIGRRPLICDACGATATHEVIWELLCESCSAMYERITEEITVAAMLTDLQWAHPETMRPDLYARWKAAGSEAAQ